MKVTLSYRGSTLSSPVTMISALYSPDGALKKYVNN